MRRGCDLCGELLAGDDCPLGEHCDDCCECLVCQWCGALVDELCGHGLCDDCCDVLVDDLGYDGMSWLARWAVTDADGSWEPRPVEIVAVAGELL